MLHVSLLQVRMLGCLWSWVLQLCLYNFPQAWGCKSFDVISLQSAQRFGVAVVMLYHYSLPNALGIQL